MAESIANLRIYQLARSLEDQVYELTKKLPEDKYELGNNLRRASAGVAHYIFEAHRQFSYQLKLSLLHNAREEAEASQRWLAQYSAEGLGVTDQLSEEYTGVIKQSWGLIKYLKNKQLEKQTQAQIKAKEELVQARS